ncbi:uncharacterized protein STEHIDRAFT_154953 [Stereum hirsutum FP-91666 SS1]|uniref:uncharacterized protein n=1 Tax=Stereum hirsutum (strain FP-91666) TaxID=721885 RepID=UPI0004410680|nr:uncharacterized protein STEHIDRAFT_154953 [Stereum hirsutum FP-91666 SS1]EIM89274.1 hypothetical protein STEHIDRAFT_154953 [Stereum hirsutum FP-91666 SS1]
MVIVSATTASTNVDDPASSRLKFSDYTRVDEDVPGEGESDSMLFDLREVVGVCAFEDDVDETVGDCGASGGASIGVDVGEESGRGDGRASGKEFWTGNGRW